MKQTQFTQSTRMCRWNAIGFCVVFYLWRHRLAPARLNRRTFVFHSIHADVKWFVVPKMFVYMPSPIRRLVENWKSSLFIVCCRESNDNAQENPYDEPCTERRLYARRFTIETRKSWRRDTTQYKQTTSFVSPKNQNTRALHIYLVNNAEAETVCVCVLVWVLMPQDRHQYL